MSVVLDEIDIKILNHLQKAGRAQRNEIADVVHLSVPSVSERMRKLEERGLIQDYVAILDATSFHFDITAFIFVEVDGSHHYPEFVKHASEHPEVLECHSITGEGSHMLKVRTKNTTTFEQFLSQVQSWGGVSKTRSNIVLSTFKESQNIPIEKTVTVKGAGR